jgi:hypothetical protein
MTIYEINSIGVPLGLLRYFIPFGASQPPQFAAERNWFFLTEKTWATQRYILDTLVTELDVFTTEAISPMISVNQIMRDNELQERSADNR